MKRKTDLGEDKIDGDGEKGSNRSRNNRRKPGAETTGQDKDHPRCAWVIASQSLCVMS